MLESWRDTQQDQSNLRYGVINILGGAQKHEDCIALVNELTNGLNTAKTGEHFNYYQYYSQVF